MNCSPSTRQRAGGKKAARKFAAFTLAEVLAALVFMAIVIPVAVRALQIANFAGEVGQRKAVAARIAERVLNEMIVTGQYQGGMQRGVIIEGDRQYQWNARSLPWTEDAMTQVSVEVIFSAQGKDYNAVLSTLIDPNLQ